MLALLSTGALRSQAYEAGPGCEFLQCERSSSSCGNGAKRMSPGCDVKARGEKKEKKKGNSLRSLLVLKNIGGK